MAYGTDFNGCIVVDSSRSYVRDTAKLTSGPSGPEVEIKLNFRNNLYKYFIKSATEICYKASLENFTEHARVLDVGIGNGIMLEKFHPLIRSKQLKITGIDINRVYLNHCFDLISKYDLQDHIQIFCRPVESFSPNPGLEFDFIFFSMSFMLLEDCEYVLDRVKEWLTPDGKIVFFQTMYKKPFPIMDFIKPRLKYFTTVEFGKVTYENDFFDLLSRKGLRVTEDRLLSREWFRGEYRLISTEFKKKRGLPENGPEKNA